MADDQHYDVIIIGTGAGGGTLAHRLAPTGKRVLILERGDYLPRERDNWDSTAVFVKGKYRAPEFWYDRHGNQFPPEVNYYVGGNTKFYGAALFRLRPEDFGELRHHDGVSPAWPIRYEDLEPYYTQAEHLYLVHGRHGEDPTGGPTSAQYAYPPVEHEARIQQLSDDLGKAGLHPFHLPIGVNLTQDDNGRATHDSVCIRCDRVDGFPCLVGAKSDAQVICVDPALEYDNVTMVTNANVRRLETDPTGRTVTSVVAELRNGVTEGFSADIVVVAAGAVNSAALLLRSAGDKHPGGLANSSDVVGRHYMRHNNLALMAVSKEPNPTRFQKTLALNDWYLGADDWEYPLGGIQMLGKSDADQIHGEAPRWAGAVTPDMPFEVLAHHAVDFWLCGEDLPLPESRVTLDKDDGIHLALDEKNNVAGLKRLQHKLQGMLGHLGMHEHHLLSHSIYLHKGMPIGATAHQAGTVRFGDDPKSSALDVNCKAHDLDNLYVVDTSFFPSIGAVNPSLTAIANALRVGDHIAARLS
ncbi:GMC oxidoreductase [Streptomyces europaeiscabiei]|uniref:GMC oxidoreductase n=1 Tax=Streptomyces europaeiscabiei TaxID=146819 RepID=UPI0006283C95|nr:GMC family oxidoreductase [Streptomyces europaeiscabiei]MDX2524474.1 GMC family oxidoreductase [Streptomyces europaeiscabiei]MDX2757069.1 GMC family oxidoreductase [Streptomyces europaeiscabiei]MDX2767634.1 GMC family oxidoreductase [Streptomyces europaeiscabiei]MDX3710390.1 GMC family oxidoreductase [Streptomyces europaeiscabiei]MDX3778260.1 GMC family oxidoreductase [Streptomyces europaeiscabiei]